MVGFTVIFSLPRVSFFMTLVALINVVFTAIAVVTVITMVTAITMITAAVAVTGVGENRRRHHGQRKRRRQRRLQNLLSGHDFFPEREYSL
ncbi:hypothetical protein O8Q81_000762 [Klebsiella oxytoca]|nr:hypothetical protein [Klebsiella oxytoca]EKJ7585386.1 hypothetical protein [Klebsiella oxytoca]